MINKRRDLISEEYFLGLFQIIDVIPFASKQGCGTFNHLTELGTGLVTCVCMCIITVQHSATVIPAFIENVIN